MIRCRNVALMHNARAIGFRELGLYFIRIFRSHFGGLNPYNAMPQGAVVPENDILLLVRMRVDIFWRQNGAHDSATMV